MKHGVNHWIDLPNRLVIVDGNLEMADGSDVQAYLRDFQTKYKVSDGSPMSLLTRRTAQGMVDHEIFSSAA